MFNDESEFKKIVDRLDIDTESNPAHRQSLRQKMICVFNEAKQKPQKQTAHFGAARRIIMKSPITKLAAAAVIIIAGLIGILKLGGSTPAFADIVRPLLTARTATFKMTIDIEDAPAQTVQGMFMEPGQMRHEMPHGNIMITDQQQGTTVSLMPAEKKAFIVEMENVPEEQRGQINMFHTIRDRIRQTDDDSVEFIGEQKVDGVNAIGYRIEEPLMKMNIWADAKTLLPIRIEYSMGKLMGAEGTMTMSDIVFNVELDESLFEIPDGYSAQTVKYDASMPSEEDFIEALRLWTQATGGKFPSELNMKTILGEYMKVYMEKMDFDVQKAPDMSDPKFQEFMQIYTKVTRGMTFAIGYPESDGHYAGKDVKFGETSTPIFWYRPQGSDTYRVIYGDLSVQNVAQENLPK
jgi:outer membrane lipoprotein-sorting protein